MRPVTSVVAILGMLSVFAAYAAEPAPERDLAKENAELQAKVEKLQKRVRELEAELARRSFVLPTPPIPALPPTQPSPFYIPNPFATPKPKSPSVPIVPSPQWVPGGWQEREFNGLHYYLIPLQENAKPESH